MVRLTISGGKHSGTGVRETSLIGRII